MVHSDGKAREPRVALWADNQCQLVTLFVDWIQRKQALDFHTI